MRQEQTLKMEVMNDNNVKKEEIAKLKTELN